MQTAYAALVPQKFHPPVVQTLDSAIYHYPVEKYQLFICPCSIERVYCCCCFSFLSVKKMFSHEVSDLAGRLRVRQIRNEGRLQE